jgi:predicted nucleic acid-binding protein
MTNTATESDKHESNPADGNSIVSSDGVGVMNEGMWLREHFPLLTIDGIKSALAERLSEAATKPPDERLQFEEIRWAVIVQARIQLEQLAVKALEIMKGSEYARAAIGEFLIAEDFELPVELAVYGQERAALTILELAPRVLPKPLIAYLVLGLTRTVEMPETARVMLLDAWQILTRKWRKYGQTSEFPPSHQVVLEALELETRRPSTLQSDAFLIAICQFISRNPHSVYTPLLLVLSTEYPSPAVRKIITETLRTIYESLEMRWLNTRTDELSDLPSRASRLEALRNYHVDTSSWVQTIFNNTRGVPIESVDDARAVWLKKLMKNQSMSIKMAVCWSLYGQGKYNPELDDFMGGISALSFVAINGLSPGLTRDALELLARLQEDYPQSKPHIEKANERASKKFIENQIEQKAAVEPTPKTFVMRSRSCKSK